MKKDRKNERERRERERAKDKRERRERERAKDKRETYNYRYREYSKKLLNKTERAKRPKKPNCT